MHNLSNHMPIFPSTERGCRKKKWTSPRNGSSHPIWSQYASLLLGQITYYSILLDKLYPIPYFRLPYTFRNINPKLILTTHNEPNPKSFWMYTYQIMLAINFNHVLYDVSLLVTVFIKKGVDVSIHQLANCMSPWMSNSMNNICTFLQLQLQVKGRKILTCSLLAIKVKTWVKL